MMTEREYIDATNLAKLRTSITILHDCLAMDDQENSDQRDAMNGLTAWRDRLEKKIVCDTTDPTSGIKP